ncbi:MFS transporter [Novosphingobium sp.]|uniref:MFS transporter n=1 Tax=Novosphingobium sp. TaxID=1874826 RepID=UPI002639E688|nr:MFS transporter [Novosphingobium sp.]
MDQTKPDPTAIERRTMRKVSWRLMPFLILCYLIAYIDRANIGFAALTMNADLGLSSAAFGLGGSLVFVAYVLFEVPSNLAQQRVGARRWIARIMISWGLVGLAMAFMAGPVSFWVLRFLLGAAEGGVFPGAVLFIAQWFPRAHRAGMVALFMIAIPLSSALGSPLAALLLSLDGMAGLAGWQWLFIIESIPALALGLIALGVLSDGPGQARWLTAEERDWLSRRLAEEGRADRCGERIRATALPLILTSTALFATLLTGSLAVTIVLLSLALLGNCAIKGPFWALAAETLPPGLAAAGLAAINALAHLGTAAAIAAVGKIHGVTGSYPLALVPLALMTLLGAGITLAPGRARAGAPA